MAAAPWRRQICSPIQYLSVLSTQYVMPVAMAGGQEGLGGHKTPSGVGWSRRVLHERTMMVEVTSVPAEPIGTPPPCYPGLALPSLAAVGRVCRLLC